MIDLRGVEHHIAVQEITKVLCNKTQNTDEKFFRAETVYFLAKMASNMRASVYTKDRGDVPVNLYALILANSGFGKGYSVSILENNLIAGFKNKFCKETMNDIAENTVYSMATTNAVLHGTTQDQELQKLVSTYKQLGTYPFTFDSGTVPAVKQLRTKLLLAGCGAMSLQIDEIGSNLMSNTDILNVFLELFDQGMVKQKLVKNTADNIRTEDIDGKTPTNMLLFGTPVKLLDGGDTEKEFYSFLETGYARRCIFALGNQEKKASHNMAPADIFKKLTDPNNDIIIKKWAAIFLSLADAKMYNWQMHMDDDVAIKLIEYRIACEQAADELSDQIDEIKKAELSHRYFKALKLAGTYAFIDKSPFISMENLLSAILLIEESGEAFQAILNREKAYVKLAKYIAANSGSDLTHADLYEALPFYKSGISARQEMMTLAIAWGYKQHILIKKHIIDGIEFFNGETLKENNLDEIIISYSDHFAYNYSCEKVPFDKLHLLTQQKGYHWANHHFKDNHRCEENVINGFNIIVIDCDGGISLDTVHELMKGVKFMTYTTKRHTDECNRFRLIIPMNYYLELDKDDYKEFMNNVLAWLPFESDESANQRSKKWESCDTGTYFYNLEAPLLDVIPFIPKTTKNEQFKKSQQKIENLTNLERWFINNSSSGNRNNQLMRYALALKDSGESLSEVKTKVMELNKQFTNPLPDSEVKQTILVSIARKYKDE